MSSYAWAFSLIELLTVVAIVAVLSAVALPVYNKYIIKARVIELLAVGDAYKVKLVENFFAAEAAQQAVYTLNTPLIDHVAVHTMAGQPPKHVIQVVAKMQNAAALGIGLAQPAAAHDPLTIQLQGIEVGEMIAWSCHVAAEYNEYVPRNCQNNDLETINIS